MARIKGLRIGPSFRIGQKFCEKCYQPVREKIIKNNPIEVRRYAKNGKEYRYVKIPKTCELCKQYLPYNYWWNKVEQIST